MIIHINQRLSRRLFTAIIIYCILSITVFSGEVSLNDVVGSWRADVILPEGIRVQSRLVVNQRGDYIEYLTNQIAIQKTSGTLVGTICISNDWLILTITNDFVEHTVLPRSGGFCKIIGVGRQRLSLVTLNGSNRVSYLRDSNASTSYQSSAVLEKAKKCRFSSVKFDSMPLSVVVTFLHDQSVEHDVDRKGVTIALGPDGKQLADVKINLELRNVTLAETLERVADSVGLEMQATDTEILIVRKKN